MSISASLPHRKPQVHPTSELASPPHAPHQPPRPSPRPVDRHRLDQRRLPVHRPDRRHVSDLEDVPTWLDGSRHPRRSGGRHRPDDENAERARTLLADLSIAQLRGDEGVAQALTPTAILGPTALAYLTADDFRPADSVALAAGQTIEELPADPRRPPSPGTAIQPTRHRRGGNRRDHFPSLRHPRSKRKQ